LSVGGTARRILSAGRWILSVSLLRRRVSIPLLLWVASAIVRGRRGTITLLRRSSAIAGGRIRSTPSVTAVGAAYHVKETQEGEQKQGNNSSWR
jgi:hypothetical protein